MGDTVRLNFSTNVDMSNFDVRLLAALIEQRDDEIERLRAELDHERGVAAAAYQSWRMNDFDVLGKQRALRHVGLKWSGMAPAPGDT